MKWTKVTIESWTASFRYPNLISGYQPTLEVPGISTVLGLLSGALGKNIDMSRNYEIGYYFEYVGKTVDLETIYQFEMNKNTVSNKTKSNVIKREILFENKLILYLNDSEMIDALKNPAYPILLGRSSDLAHVSSVETVDLEGQENAKNIRGQIIPINEYVVPGTIQALPTYFTNELPRKNIGTKPYSIVPHYLENREHEYSIPVQHDPSIGKAGVDIYFHKIDFH